MDVRIIPSETRYRRRSRSNVGRFLMQLTFFLASLIPMCIIAWRIDLIGLTGPNDKNVRQEPIAQPRTMVQSDPRPRAAPRSTAGRRASARDEPRTSSIASESEHTIPQDWFQPASSDDQVPENNGHGMRLGDREALRKKVDDALATDGGLEPLPAALRPVGKPQVGAEQTDDGLPKPCAIVSLDLKETVIRVLAETQNTPANELLVDIGLSDELRGRPIQRADKPSRRHTIVARDLGDAEKHSVLFNAGISDVKVGLEVTIVYRDSVAIAELRPKYILPSGDEESFVRSRGMRKYKTLAKQLQQATEANSALPSLSSQWSTVKSEYDTHSRVANESVGSISRYAQKLQSANRAAAAERAGEALSRQIVAAERLVAALPAIRADYQAIESIAKYGGLIAELGTVYVRFHHNGESFIADVR